MEACGSAHHGGRAIRDLGHEVRLIPPAYVNPLVKRQKNDAADAEPPRRSHRDRRAALGRVAEGAAVTTQGDEQSHRPLVR